VVEGWPAGARGAGALASGSGGSAFPPRPRVRSILGQRAHWRSGPAEPSRLRGAPATQSAAVPSLPRTLVAALVGRHIRHVVGDLLQ